MPRKHLFRSTWIPYHVFNQANNRVEFPAPLDQIWEILAETCFQSSLLAGVKVHAFVLMPNHYHLLLSTPQMDLGQSMQIFSSSSTQSFNRKSGRVGHLFRGKYKWCAIDSPLYFAHALKYIYRNPVKAKLCARVEEYPFSSLKGVLGLSPLPFPIDWPQAPGWERLIPEDTQGLLDWLNRAPAETEQEAVRKALRRRIFEISSRIKGCKPRLQATL